MKYLKDLNDIIASFPKYVLIYSDLYEAIAYLIRDKLNELSIEFNNKNKFKIIIIIQDIFDIVNPYVDNIFSSFNLDEEYNNFILTFINDEDEFNRTGFLIKKEIKVNYREQ